MKTSSKTVDSLERNPQQITGQRLTNNNASEKASSDFLKEHHDNEISSNQAFKLIKLTLLITLAAFLMTACEEEPVYSKYKGPVTPPPSPIAIHNMYPAAGAPGSTVAILGENFSSSATDNFVAFGSSYAQILYVTYGVINVRVPMDLQEGDYRITVSSNGQSAEAPLAFRVTDDNR